MKIILAIFVPILLIAVGVVVLVKMQIIPFGRAKKKPPTAVATQKPGEESKEESKPEGAGGDTADSAGGADAGEGTKPAGKTTPAAPRPAAPPVALKTETPVRTAPPVVQNSRPDPQAERNLARVTALYETMSAEDAAKVMTKLPDALVEKVLRRMDEGKAGKLLLLLGPDRAARLTLALTK
jgi:predicted lipid-binding transport protein (Tim44 family)